MIYFITGGERSGKSRHAQQLALRLSASPVYVATARRWDKDFEKRIDRHISERDERWTSVEEQLELQNSITGSGVFVVDCVTLWLTNIFSDAKYDVEESLARARQIFELMKRKEATLIIISNEIGMGVHASSEVGRKFVELQGWVNQHIAASADEVIFMVSGIPLLVKSKSNHATTAGLYELERG